MDPLVRYRQLIGIRPGRLGVQANEAGRLQELYAGTIPDDVCGFLTALSDCVLYYRFEATTKTGKIKPYSHFMTTNIGPELDGISPFPASIMGKVARYRGMGLPDGYLPLMAASARTAWIWYDLARSCVVVPRGSSEFGTSEREWTVIAPSFDDFVRAMQLDVSPLLHTFRIAGTGHVQPSMREWLTCTLGEDWESRIQELLRRKRRPPGPDQPSQ